jgi:hypothetical protein
MRIRLVPFAFLFVLLSGRGAQAQVLPPPYVPPPRSMLVLPPAGKPVPTLPLAALPYPPPGYQPSAYQVWQNYGLTYDGWLRPRVIQTGNSGYWLYNGAPFPYVYTSPMSYYSSTIAPSGAPSP